MKKKRSVKKATVLHVSPPLSSEAAARVEAARKTRKDEAKARKEHGRDCAILVGLEKIVPLPHGPKAK
jgi:hypothetical protein